MKVKNHNFLNKIKSSLTKKHLFILAVVPAIILPVFTFKFTTPSKAQTDSLIKGKGSATTYYYADDGYRYVFPNEKTFFSWFTDFEEVTVISDKDLANIPLKGNITHRPGLKMVKIQSSSKVYAVEKGGALRWIQTEELARQIYGYNWNQNIEDIPDAFFINYKEGDPLATSTIYSATTTLSVASTINQDKGIKESTRALKATTFIAQETLEEIEEIAVTPTISITPATSTAPGAIVFTPTAPISTSTITTTPATSTISREIILGLSGGSSDIVAPTISNIQATSTSSSMAVITWDTDELSNSLVQYATGTITTAPTSSIPQVADSTFATSHTIVLNNLTELIDYYYIVKSVDKAGNAATSNEYIFVVPDTTPPLISNIQGSNITGTGAIISWAINEESTHIVYYGLTSSYGMSTTAASSTSPSINLSSLTSDTTYHFKVSSTDGRGNISESDDKTFTTTGRIKTFAISDNFYSIASETQKQQFASRIDFIWSGDYFPGDWKTYNPNLILGLYMPLNAFDTGRLPRCKTNSDCFNSTTGYTCVPITSNNRYFQWWMDGEGVCWHASGWGSCATNQDCAIDGLTYKSGTLYPGSCDTASHICRYSVQQQRAIEHNYWMANYHPEWILYRCATDGTPLTGGQHPDNVAWYSGAPQIPVDFTNSDVRTDYKRRLSSLYSRNPNRYSVVSIDVVYPTNATRACGVYDAGGTFRQIFEGDSKFNLTSCGDYYGFCDRNYIDELYSWLSDLNSFAAESLNSKIFANLVSHTGIDWDAVVVQPVPADNPILKTNIYSVVDGVLDESGFTRNMSRQGTIPDKPSTWTYAHNSDVNQMWTKQKGYAELANSLGINYYNKNGIYQLYSMDTEKKKQASEWALASHLISNQNTMKLYFCSNPDDSLLNNALNWPQLDVDYGRPCGAAQQQTANPLVYTRTYNRAFVVAHTGDSSSSAYTMSTMSLPLPAENFYTWNSAGEAYTDSVGSQTFTIEYQQGRIFYSPTDLCPLSF